MAQTQPMRVRSGGNVGVAGAILLAVVLAPPAARAEDEWLGADKVSHAVVSGSIAGGVTCLALTQTRGRFAPYLVGGGVALGLGLGKEGYDALGGGTASMRDLTWDVVGAAVGLGLALVLDLALGRD